MYMTLTEVGLTILWGVGLGMLVTMVADRLSGGRFIEIFFPFDKPEIVMTTAKKDEEATEEEEN